jgi:hypothetical protein
MECTKRKFLIGYRAFFGLLTLTAIGKQLTIQLQGGFSLTNFFSFFTNLSNLFAAIILILGAIYLIKRREPTVKDDIIRGTSVACMALVGMVFSVLLRDVDLGHLLPWVNILLHYIMPIVIVIDWLYPPPKNKLKLGQIVYGLIFPLLYLAYSIIRGAILGFYAYPFFNPAKSGGYGGVALYCIAIAATFFFFSWLLIAVGNKLNKECVIDTL